MDVFPDLANYNVLECDGKGFKDHMQFISDLPPLQVQNTLVVIKEQFSEAGPIPRYADFVRVVEGPPYISPRQGSRNGQEQGQMYMNDYDYHVIPNGYWVPMVPLFLSYACVNGPCIVEHACIACNDERKKLFDTNFIELFSFCDDQYVAYFGMIYSTHQFEQWYPKEYSILKSSMMNFDDCGQK